MWIAELCDLSLRALYINMLTYVCMCHTLSQTHCAEPLVAQLQSLAHLIGISSTLRTFTICWQCHVTLTYVLNNPASFAMFGQCLQRQCFNKRRFGKVFNYNGF